MSVIIDGTTGITAPLILKQIVHFKTSAVATGTTLLPYDDTIPQSNEGDQYMSVTITPSNASSTLEIAVGVSLSHSAGASGVRKTIALFQDSIANALSCALVFKNDAHHDKLTLVHIMTAGTTSPITFKVRAGGNLAGTITVNGSGGNRQMGGVDNSYIIVKEYIP